MNRITFTKPNGDWGIDGIDLAQLPPKLYGAIMKLKRYEDSGLLPDEVIDTVRDNRRNREGGEEDMIDEKEVFPLPEPKRETTRIFTVEVTMISGEGHSVTKEAAAGQVRDIVKAALDADDVVVAKVQDFVRE